MTAISDAVVIGVVLGLVFAAVSQYLQSRITQQDRKISLMENILLDLKVTTEQTLLASTEPGEIQAASSQGPSNVPSTGGVAEQKAFEETEVAENTQTRELTVDATPRARPASPQVQVERVGSTSSVGPNYEAMTYRELVALARQNSVSGIRNLSKAQLIEVLRSHRGTLTPVPTDAAETGSITNHGDLTSQTQIEDAGTTSLDSFLPLTADNTGPAPIQEEPEVSLVQ